LQLLEYLQLMALSLAQQKQGWKQLQERLALLQLVQDPLLGRQWLAHSPLQEQQARQARDLAVLERQTHLERLAWLRFDPEIATFDWADDWQLGDQPNLAGHSSRGAIGRKIAKR
jgi:hypothetical protein